MWFVGRWKRGLKDIIQKEEKTVADRIFSKVCVPRSVSSIVPMKTASMLIAFTLELSGKLYFNRRDHNHRGSAQEGINGKAVTIKERSCSNRDTTRKRAPPDPPWTLRVQGGSNIFRFCEWEGTPAAKRQSQQLNVLHFMQVSNAALKLVLGLSMPGGFRTCHIG